MRITKKILAYMLPLALAAGLFWYTYKDTDFGKIIESLSDVNYWWIGLSSVFMIISHWARAKRWIMIYAPLGFYPKPKNAFLATMGGYFANLLLPRMGEITRCALLKRTDEIDMDKSVGTVLAERAADLLTLLFFSLIAVILKFELLSGFFTDLLSQKKSKTTAAHSYLSLGFIGVLCVGLFAVLLIVFLVFRTRILQSKLFANVGSFAKGIWLGMMSIFKIKAKAIFLVYTILIWGGYLLTAQVSFFAFEPTASLPFYASFMILVVGSYGMIVPVQGGFGAYHAIVALSFVRLYGLSQSSAEAAALLLHSAQTIFTLVVGGLCFLYALQISKKKADL